MVAKASIIEIYARADAAGRVDIICMNYSNFIGIVDGCKFRFIGSPIPLATDQCFRL